MDDYTSTPLINLSSAEETVLKPITDVRKSCVLFRIVFNSGLIGIICFLGLAGNILSLAILHSDRQNRVASFLLQALAVADTAVLVISCFVLTFVYGILHSQTTVVTEWMDFIFKYVNSLGYMTQGVTIWLTVLLAINRYIAVCRPLHANRLGIKGAKIQVSTFFSINHFFSISKRANDVGYSK